MMGGMNRRECLAAGAGGALASLLAASRVTADDLTLGQHRLRLAEGDRDGLFYIPKGYKPEVAMPLWVVLHGAGGTAQSTAYTFPLADEFGVVIVSPDARDERTWDGVLHNWGPDVDFIAAAIGQVSRLCKVDSQRMAVAGFSDGASYALSLGITYGDQFSRIVAMSPGVMEPMAARGKPKIFISHGTADRVMPIDDTSRRFVPKLKTLGYDVTYREYEGRHTVSPPIVREAFEWALR
jgi:phospholipase/carboxylesterase